MPYSEITKEKIKAKTGPKKRSLKERFWLYVEPLGEDDCWLWNGGTRGGTSYGTISDELGNGMGTHRVSFELHYRPLEPAEIVMHSCDAKACVNPKHLYVGDKWDWAQKWHAVDVTDDYLAQREQKKQQRSRKQYIDNKEARKAYVRKYQMDQKIKAVEYLGGKCVDCGFTHPAALQFHHRDPSLKLFSITTKELSSPKKMPWDSVIVPELLKCDLICSNCHFIRHCTWEVECENPG